MDINLKKNKRNLKSLIISELIMACIIAGICSFFLGILLDKFYTVQLDKANLYEDLAVDLKNYEEVPDEFLVENNASIGVVDDNLSLIEIRGLGIGVSKGHKYTPIEFAELIGNTSFTKNVTYEKITYGKNHKTVFLIQNFNEQSLEKLNNFASVYYAVSIIGNLIILLVIFLLFVKRIYTPINTGFSLIQKNIMKTPYDKSKAALAEAKLVEVESVIEVYNNMIDELESVKLENDNIVNQSNRLIANLSHDLKSPITILKGYAELLVNEDLSKEQYNEYLYYINQGTTDLSNLVTLLFEQVKFQHATHIMNFENYDINSILRDICANYYMIFEKKGFDMNISISEEAHYMDFDLVNMKRAFCNILDNCLNHNPIPTKVEIATYEEGGKFIICFKDDGVGISNENSDKIFEPFFQGDPSRNKLNSGLGLYGTKLIVERHKGTIELTKEPNYKTVFKIVF